MTHRPRAPLTALAGGLLVAALTLLVANPAQARPASTVDVQVLAFNDFHGNLQPPSGSSGNITTLDAGGNRV
jgi:5'-nucleotidase